MENLDKTENFKMTKEKLKQEAKFMYLDIGFILDGQNYEKKSYLLLIDDKVHVYYSSLSRALIIDLFETRVIKRNLRTDYKIAHTSFQDTENVLSFEQMEEIKQYKKNYRKLQKKQEQEYIKNKLESLKQEAKFMYLDLGVTYGGGYPYNSKYYLFLVDDKLHVYFSDFKKEVVVIELTGLSINESSSGKADFDIREKGGINRYSVSSVQKDKFINYCYEFKEKEIKIIEKEIDRLFSQTNVEEMFKNYLTEALEDNFVNLQNFTLLEDYYYKDFFGFVREREYVIKKEFKAQIEFKYDKFIDLLKYREVINKEERYHGYYYLLLTKALKKVSVEVYGQKFHNNYHGYFIDLLDLTYKECIRTFFSIDIINHESKTIQYMFTYFLLYHNKLSIGDNQDLFYDGFSKVQSGIKEMNYQKELLQLEDRLLKKQKSINPTTIDDVDLMTGTVFENFVAELFKKMGYSTKQTKNTGDQGIDIIAVKDGIRIGIQTKCYANSVSNKAIQEVKAGLKFYHLDKGMVLTNSHFTKGAINLANSNEIILWDRLMLKEKMHEYYRG
ncbi:restriction endonuclease [Radiobacillus kanasensis]|uniref:restriction endonuclease n=1 Tax=Radiobacillus kanasensis TaxID=2844358 RepID=UPI001E4A2614|nr:restriction endonuclease [Radiobacillus kanasensis]UFT99365.1 restriction endonuclease [Radiobacillus kanasensis]